MIPDVNALIQGFYHDLETKISDLHSLDITLSLDHIDPGFGSTSEDFSIFIYEAPESEFRYHLKRGYSLPLPKTDGYTKLIFEPRPDDDCSDLQLLENSKRFELSFQDSKTIQLVIKSKGRSNYLVIPETCLLFLTRAERTIRSFYSKQLEFSHRNSRRPELIGLKSTQVHNWNRFDYIETLKDITNLPLIAYTETSASFSFVPTENDTFVVPQNSSLVLFNPETEDWTWDEYTVKLRFRRFEDPKCRVPENNRPGVSFRELEGGEAFEIKYQAHELTEALEMDVLPDCELKLTFASAEISFASRFITRKRFRCSMTPEIAQESHFDLNNGRLFAPMPMVHCLEELSDFPALFFQPRRTWFGLKTFQTAHFEPSAVPNNLRLLLHSTVKDAADFQRDTVTLTFEMTSKSCQIRRHGEITAGFSIQKHSNSQTIRVIYKSHLLDAEFPIGTEFAIEASCNLKFIKAVRLIKSPIHYEYIQLAPESDTLSISSTEIDLIMKLT